MSAEESTDGPAARFVDSVTPSYVGRPNSEMHAIGLLLGGVLIVLLIPLLPFVAVLWAVSRLADGRQRPDRESLDDRPGRTRPS